ncbi:chemotaxis protein CheA [Tundrisphaera sp. TA3]|uniref:chemotaxis protein CheA n=1 Tax=Tundrisphaera sp. TA3 TaxID=3435775 RepID=UPI003EBC489E
MSGFDLASLLPCYLDETDEQIAGLGAALLKLEASPADGTALRDAFRLIHTIKGSSMVLGFAPVKDLTHHLEAYFEGLRSGKRALDRASLDLCFLCLDALRDYHNELRAGGASAVDLAALTEQVRTIPDQPPPPAPPPVPVPAGLARTGPPGPDLGPRAVCLTVRFEPKLPWPDMKAKLVLNRLAAKGRVIATDPPDDRFEEIEDLHQFQVWIEADGEVAELLALADVDGVAEVKADAAGAKPGVPPSPAEPNPPAREEAPPPPIQPGIPPGGAEPDAAPAVPPPVEIRGKVAETVRVDVERLDQLMNLAGELVISKSRFFEIARGLDDIFRDSNAHLLAADTLDRLDGIARGLEGQEGVEAAGHGSIGRWAAQVRRLRENFRSIEAELDLIRQGRERLGAMSEAIDHLSRVSDGIQRGVLETRMVPIGPLFDRFHRVIRDLKQSSDKEVVLRTEGEKTELDKRMIDELGDPLVHLIRNAVDHGLEPPEAREAAGKPRVGTVSLAASHRGNSVVITVGDDGRGIDREKVRRKAVSKGLIGEEESLRLTDRQVVQFIFHPGLSTAEAVTDISGRGVGMDIVKSRIEALNGTVDARPEPGRGTVFTIRLPLTLAIMSVLLARVGEEVYAIPLDHLDEIVEVEAGQVYRVHGRRAIDIRGRITSLVTLGDAFRQDGLRRTGDEEEANDEKYTVVVVSNGESTIGLIVDELLGMQEAVLKSLARNFRPVHGLSGASILGDGSVCLILDIDALINMATAEASHPGATPRPALRREG